MTTERASAKAGLKREGLCLEVAGLYGLKATHTDIGLHNSPYIRRLGRA